MYAILCMLHILQSKAPVDVKAYVLAAAAIELQQQVIDAWNRHGPKEMDERIVHDILEHKRKTHGTSPDRLPTKAMPLLGKGYASRLPDSSAK
ncbi:hypothetical protein PTKIN_Ptkin10aG0199400 [Pterospermum kingtungense]